MNRDELERITEGANFHTAIIYLRPIFCHLYAQSEKSHILDERER